MKSPLPTLPADAIPYLDPSEICPPCARCCKYVSLGMESPDNVKYVSMALWFLFHKGIGIYQAHDDDWYLIVPTDCEHLLESGLCGVYENRPFICREYDVADCEGTSTEPSEKRKFMDAGSFLNWLERSRPALYKRCLEKGIIPKPYRTEEEE